MKRVMAGFGLLAAAGIAPIGSAAQTPVRAQVKPYAASEGFRNVANYAAFNKAAFLSPEQKEILRRNLFVCYPRDDTQLYWIYGRNDYHNLPSLVTTDAVLQLHHVFYDSTLRITEESALYKLVGRLTSTLLADAVSTWRTAQDPALKRAALKNVAYLGVVARILGDQTTLPPEAAAMVAKEEALIQSAQGYAVGAIFPYKIDYSQFIVRGHYSKSPTLQRYFRAMMWYGLVPMALKYEANGQWVRADEQILQSLLLTRSLYQSGALQTWERIYDPTSLFVGAANDLTPQEWKQAMDRVYGANAAAEAFADTKQLDRFVSEVEKLRKPAIRAERRDKNRPDTEAQFRLMGQRAIPDSKALQKLTGEKRIFPSGLDVMAVLGSDRAAKILDADPVLYNPKGWADYVPTRRTLTQEFAQVPASTWNSNLYWGWLNTLRALLDPVPAGYPSFMRSRAWQDKSLNAALASWAELRHDTILYGLQSATESGDGEEPPFVPGYVEPNVVFFDRLLALTRQSRDELARRSLLPQQVADRYHDYLDMLGFLRSVAVRELQNGKLTRKEHERIRHIEGELEYLTESMMKAAGNYVALSQDDLDMALVADVHTGNSSALTEGVGHSMAIVAVVPVEGKLYLARGSTFSYYEFKVPIAQRMTDETWKRQLAQKRAPALPAWTRSYLTSSTA